MGVDMTGFECLALIGFAVVIFYLRGIRNSLKSVEAWYRQQEADLQAAKDRIVSLK